MDIKKIISPLFNNGIRRFSNLHKGESCYIFGDGPSIKWFDLSEFDNFISICCGFLPFHKDFSLLNIKYCSLLGPWYLTPKLIQPNISYLPNSRIIAAEYIKVIKKAKDLKFFTSLSNIISPLLLQSNLHYVWKTIPKRNSLDSRINNNCDVFCSSFHGSLSLAYYLGFTKVYLVGFDAWTIQPARNMHWYEKGVGIYFEATNFSITFLEILKEAMDIYTISVDGDSMNVQNIPYETYTGKPPIFRENYELLSTHYLNVMASEPKYKIL